MGGEQQDHRNVREPVHEILKAQEREISNICEQREIAIAIFKNGRYDAEPKDWK